MGRERVPYEVTSCWKQREREGGREGGRGAEVRRFEGLTGGGNEGGREGRREGELTCNPGGTENTLTQGPCRIRHTSSILRAGE